MKRKFPLYLLLGMMISALAMSCNEDSDDAYEEYVISNSTAITAFNLNSDDSVLANLDSLCISPSTLVSV